MVFDKAAAKNKHPEDPIAATPAAGKSVKEAAMWLADSLPAVPGLGPLARRLPEKMEVDYKCTSPPDAAKCAFLPP